MNITSKHTSISATVIDSTLYAIRKSLMSKHGVDGSTKIIDPLIWYISSGRASTVFLRNLIEAKPFMVGRVLAKGGSYDEVIRNIKKYIGYVD